MTSLWTTDGSIITRLFGPRLIRFIGPPLCLGREKKVSAGYVGKGAFGNIGRPDGVGI